MTIDEIQQNIDVIQKEIAAYGPLFPTDKQLVLKYRRDLQKMKRAYDNLVINFSELAIREELQELKLILNVEFDNARGRDSARALRALKRFYITIDSKQHSKQTA